MGYLTYYELEVLNNRTPLKEIIKEFSKDCESVEYALGENGGQEEQIKWYDHEEDLTTFSKKYPRVLFKLTGEGEESGDIWVKYVRNGLLQVCRATITFEEFDESKLN